MIEYVMEFANAPTVRLTVDLERRSASSRRSEQRPEWTRLEFRKCTNCPLKPPEHPCCPVAADIEPALDAFRSVISHARARVTVLTPARTYFKDTDVQEALRSYLGLVMSTSECPYFSKLRGMAHLHLPFATVNETVFRTVGAYLIQQYYVQNNGGSPDWRLEGLKLFFSELQEVNRCFKARVDAASDQDANMNAAASLVYLAMSVSFSLEENLLELEPFLTSIGIDVKHRS